MGHPFAPKFCRPDSSDDKDQCIIVCSPFTLLLDVFCCTGDVRNADWVLSLSGWVEPRREERRHPTKLAFNSAPSASRPPHRNYQTSTPQSLFSRPQPQSAAHHGGKSPNPRSQQRPHRCRHGMEPSAVRHTPCPITLTATQTAVPTDLVPQLQRPSLR